jgi:Zn-dependent protease with chaperone function
MQDLVDETKQDASPPVESLETASLQAAYFDGLTSQKRFVTLRTNAHLEIVKDGTFLAAWAFDDIRRADGPPDVLRLCNVAGAPLARLEIRDLATRTEIERVCKDLDGEGAPGDGSKRKIVFWSLAATVSVLSIIWFAIPLLADKLTPFVPIALEKRLGEASNTQIKAIFGGKICKSPGGTAALQKLVGELQAKAQLRIAPEPEVMSSVVPNAFALPGGKVYVLSKLLDKAESPDEVAAVLAHEFGHIAHRDGLRRLIADGSTSFLFGLLFGDVTGASVVILTGKSLLSAAYSRDAEAGADLFAQNLMQKLGRPPKALGTLLLRIEGSDKTNPLGIFATHPLTADRIAALAESPETQEGPPLLSAGEWLELKAICK